MKRAASLQVQSMSNDTLSCTMPKSDVSISISSRVVSRAKTSIYTGGEELRTLHIKDLLVLIPHHEDEEPEIIPRSFSPVGLNLSPNPRNTHLVASQEK